MPLYEFICGEGHVTEKLVAGYDCTSVYCRCGKAASRAQVNRIGFSGFAKTPVGQHDFRDDYRRFREASEGLDYDASKVERNEGVSLSSPLFKEAKKQAAVLTSKGVSADDL